jgi:glycine oxidase
MLDYLIIGSGIAGISFCEIALLHNKSILVLDNNSQNSSKIAAGLYNPVILKRFSEVPNAKKYLAVMTEFYTILEQKLDCTVDRKLPILRKFFSVEEQNNWFAASDKINLSDYLSTTLITKKYSKLESPFGYGRVLQTGFVNTALMITRYKEYLRALNLYKEDTFEYNLLKEETYNIVYKDIRARHIIFAEGFGMHANPYFNSLPLDGTKGELLLIKAPLLNLDTIVNTSIFIIPIGDDLYKVGSTYDWYDKTNTPTENGKLELVEKLGAIITCDFEIIEHLAAIRPTVKDRNPLVGHHKNHKSIHILNGLGTRGILIAPAMAQALFQNIEYDVQLDRTIDIKRFDKKL